MLHRVALLTAVAVGGCGRNGAPSNPVTSASSATGSDVAASTSSGVSCTLDPSYPGMWELAEASAAAEFEPRPGERSMIAFADSGNHGQAMILPLVPPGPLREVHLELDRLASDDIEGASWRGGHLYTLTSSGGVRRYTPSKTGELVRDRTAYPIGAYPLVCDTLYNGNCGKNYEGLCLRAATNNARCAGYAASKTENALYCVVFHGDALAVDTIKPPIRLNLHAHALSDCAFGSAGGPAEDVLLVSTNLYGGSTVYIVDEGTGGLTPVDVPSLPNNEAIAVDRDGALYEFMDGNTSVSPTYRSACTGWSTAGSH